MKDIYIYLIYSIIGAILFPLLYYLSKQKNNLLCALIPMMPFMGLLGLILINYFDGGTNDYLLNIITFTILYILLFTSIYIILINSNNLLFSIVLSLLIWFVLVYNYLYYKKNVLKK